MENIIQMIERAQDVGAGWVPTAGQDTVNGGHQTTGTEAKYTGGPENQAKETNTEEYNSGLLTAEDSTQTRNPLAAEATSEQPQYPPYASSLEISSNDIQETSTQSLTVHTASTSTAEPFTHPGQITTSSATSTTLEIPSQPTTTQVSATNTSTDTTDTDNSNSLNSTKIKLAIALPIAIVGLLVIAALIFFFTRRRRRRSSSPAYNIARGETSAISTSELMAAQKAEASGHPTSNVHHLPVIEVPQHQNQEPTPGSATARSGMNDSHTELGLAVALPMSERHSASERDLPRFSGSASRTSTPRMPFESRDGHDDDDDNVSIVSDMNERRNRERDFDDMSSVSSFEDDENDRHENSHDHGRSR